MNYFDIINSGQVLHAYLSEKNIGLPKTRS